MKELPRCNLVHKKCKIQLNNGEYLCPDCHGRGCFFTMPNYKRKHVSAGYCYMCQGNGKVDWITWANRRRKLPKERTLVISFKCPRNKQCKVIKRAIKRRTHKDEDLRLAHEWALTRKR